MYWEIGAYDKNVVTVSVGAWACWRLLGVGICGKYKASFWKTVICDLLSLLNMLNGWTEHKSSMKVLYRANITNIFRWWRNCTKTYLSEDFLQRILHTYIDMHNKCSLVSTFSFCRSHLIELNLCYISTVSAKPISRYWHWQQHQKHVSVNHKT